MDGAAALNCADICDRHPDEVRVLGSGFSSVGGRQEFAGPVATVRVFEDNVLVRAALTEPGHGRVLVVDGGGSIRCALLGDRLATIASVNGWAGVVINGCVRDTAALRAIDVGVVAIGSHPRASEKQGQGERDQPVTFGGVTFVPGHHVIVDADGVLTLPRPP